MMRNEQGSALSVFVVGCWTVCLLGLVVAADWGRFFIYREQLQAAADAAALSGTLHTKKMVSVRIERERHRSFTDSCWNSRLQRWISCMNWTWEPASDGYLEGTEYTVWRHQPGSYEHLCRYPYRCTSPPAWNCWLEPVGGAYGPLQVAEATLVQNVQSNQRDDIQFRLVDIRYEQAPVQDWGGRYWWAWEDLRVHVHAELTMPTVIWGLIGGRSEMTVRLSQPVSAMPVRREQGPPC